MRFLLKVAADIISRQLKQGDACVYDHNTYYMHLSNVTAVGSYIFPLAEFTDKGLFKEFTTF